MTRYIALLRGINVGGHRIIKMEALKDFFVSRGFQDVKTYIQSGNIIFDAAEKNAARLEKSLEQQMHEWLGYEVTVILRTPQELQEVIRRSPFSNLKNPDDYKLYVIFLPREPEAESKKALEALSTADETYEVNGREVFLRIRKASEKPPSNTNLERKLKMPGTNRNWATVNRLAAM